MAAARRSAATPAQGYLRRLAVVKPYGFLQAHGFLESVRDPGRPAASLSRSDPGSPRARPRFLSLRIPAPATHSGATRGKLTGSAGAVHGGPSAAPELPPSEHGDLRCGRPRRGPRGQRPSPLRPERRGLQRRGSGATSASPERGGSVRHDNFRHDNRAWRQKETAAWVEGGKHPGRR